jgi:hypothetical protein
MSVASRYVIARESNVLRVDFRHEPDPPAPKFPGAAAVRTDTRHVPDAVHPSRTKEVA